MTTLLTIPIDASCQSCRWFRPDVAIPENGQCDRYPPTGMRYGKIESIDTKPSHLCGEWHRVVEVKEIES